MHIIVVIDNLYLQWQGCLSEIGWRRVISLVIYFCLLKFLLLSIQSNRRCLCKDLRQLTDILNVFDYSMLSHILIETLRIVLC